MLLGCHLISLICFHCGRLKLKEGKIHRKRTPQQSPQRVAIIRCVVCSYKDVLPICQIFYNLNLFDKRIDYLVSRIAADVQTYKALHGA